MSPEVLEPCPYSQDMPDTRVKRKYQFSKSPEGIGCAVKATRHTLWKRIKLHLRTRWIPHEYFRYLSIFTLLIGLYVTPVLRIAFSHKSLSYLAPQRPCIVSVCSIMTSINVERVSYSGNVWDNRLIARRFTCLCYLPFVKSTWPSMVFIKKRPSNSKANTNTFKRRQRGFESLTLQCWGYFRPKHTDVKTI